MEGSMWMIDYSIGWCMGGSMCIIDHSIDPSVHVTGNLNCNEPTMSKILQQTLQLIQSHSFDLDGKPCTKCLIYYYYISLHLDHL